MLHMNYIIELLHSDFSLSVRAHPLENIYELFHGKTSLRELNKHIDSYVFSQFNNNERCGTIFLSLVIA